MLSLEYGFRGIFLYTYITKIMHQNLDTVSLAHLLGLSPESQVMILRQSGSADPTDPKP